MISTACIYICGIGPGHPDFIVPKVFDLVQTADLLIGGKRHLEIFASFEKAQYVFDGDLNALTTCLQDHLDKNVVIVVSGDTGFYSLRRYIQSQLANVPIKVIPGISSFQYFYAKLGLGYEKAYLGSLHGKQLDFLALLKQYASVFLLTDRNQTYQKIASMLVDAGYGKWTMHVGNRLSYLDEYICSAPASEMLEETFEVDLCAVIIENPEWT